ncbi:nuclease HARBI1 [Labeo rohita]|uniref:Nuclease HARBI1 n=1 Tax=Labeo rohita TaxID=84645 RepID=A0A498NZB6_LABRO|nr:nuclease HARBI1 [Labeo rohita]
MGDEEWMSRLRKFAAVGVWPSEAGNRPAPRQKKWHDLYLKITKKLSGFAKGTTLWLTSVSNEVGQILISVLTAQEGPALDTMAADLIRRLSSCIFEWDSGDVALLRQAKREQLKRERVPGITE